MQRHCRDAFYTGSPERARPRGPKRVRYLRRGGRAQHHRSVHGGIHPCQQRSLHAAVANAVAYAQRQIPVFFAQQRQTHQAACFLKQARGKAAVSRIGRRIQRNSRKQGEHRRVEQLLQHQRIADETTGAHQRGQQAAACFTFEDGKRRNRQCDGNQHRKNASCNGCG